MQHTGAVGLYLLFARGKRPTRSAVCEFAEKHHGTSLSHDPGATPPLYVVDSQSAFPSPNVTALKTCEEEDVWVELLSNGLTFDLAGLAPGPGAEFPEVSYRFDLEAAPTPSRYEAVRLLPGQHLSGGAQTVPIMRGLVELARDLTNQFEEMAVVVWPPSRSAIGRRYFESVATAWLEGGAFPALGLTAFRETIDQGLQSVGLSFWIGKELRIEPNVAPDKVSATRLGVRIVNQLVLVGGLDGTERIVAPDGSRLVMKPSDNGKFIRVWRE